MASGKEGAFRLLADGDVTSPQGFTGGVAACGIKESGNLDVAVVYSESDCVTTGMFTTNQVAAAPVILDRETLAANRTTIRGIVADAGNANACTGGQGLADAREMQQLAAARLDCRPEQFLVLSTGVIGVPLPMARVREGIRIATENMSAGSGTAVAQAIMTTDTHPKHLAVQLDLPEGQVTIGGVTKGAAMIHPNMATTLLIVTSDAAISPELQQQIFRVAIENSYNRISVDGDTSTNDSALFLANGASGVPVAEGASLAVFSAGLNALCTELAKMIVRDGEGASKFVEFQVTGTATVEDAHQIAETIATSPLVKTAIAGGDPNWGRILAAAGRAGVSFDQEEAALWIHNPDGPVLQLLSGGSPTMYEESQAEAIFARPDICVHLSLGDGEGKATMWTCDLTHEYITLNADYRT